MQKAKREFFKKKLVKMRASILDKAKRLKEDSYTRGTDGIQDMADAASNAYNADILMSLRDPRGVGARRLLDELHARKDAVPIDRPSSGCWRRPATRPSCSPSSRGGGSRATSAG